MVQLNFASLAPPMALKHIESPSSFPVLDFTRLTFGAKPFHSEVETLLNIETVKVRVLWLESFATGHVDAVRNGEGQWV